MSSVAGRPRFLELLPVLVLAAWARLAVFPAVLVEGVSPASGDAEYHLRRILLAFDSFPGLSVRDPLLGWPHGAAHPWAPGFDWVGAALLHLTFLKDPRALAFVAALYPVLLGLGCVLLVVELTSRLLRGQAHRLTPLAAGALAALVPQFVGTSRLARIDHHVWEALSVLLLLRWSLDSLEPSGPSRPWRFEALGLVAALVTLAGFVGGPLYLALTVPLLVLRPLRAEGAVTLVGSGAPALSAAAALTALINWGPISEHGRPLSFGYPSLLQPALSLAAGGAVALAVLASRWSRPSRRLGMMGAALAVLTLAALFAPGLGPQLRGGLVDWLWKKDPWLSGISEFQPFFSLGRPALDTVLHFLGLTGLVAVPLWLVALALQREARRELLAFSFVFAVLLALTALQMRFGRVLAPLLGVACALGLSALVRLTGPHSWPLLFVTPLLLTAADPEVRGALILRDPRPPSPIEELADALAVQTPPRPGNRDGVLASWELGNTLLSRAGRPVIASGFGSYVDAEGFELSATAFSADEATLLAVMERRDLGFVVTGAASLLKEQSGRQLLEPQTGWVSPEAMARRPVSVLMVGGSGLFGVVRHAEQLMPIEASAQQVERLAGPMPRLWLYERVEGARVSAHCVPGELLTARLEARVGERPFEWRAWTTCGAEGQATLSLAVPSGFAARGFSTAPEWSLATAAGERRFSVDETSIRSGALLAP